ncbi:hypothetical protein GCM10020000_51760 [Streptomyces olivoverticillatus]
MRKTLRWLLALTVTIGTVGAGGVTTTATAAARSDQADIKERILKIPGMSLVEDKPYEGYRYLVMTYTQPVDHRDPSKGTFKQRFSLLHKSTDRPTVFFTSGYNLSTDPSRSRSEPTRIVDGNQLSLEYRYFTPSRPQPSGLVEARHMAGGQRPAPPLPGAQAHLRQELAGHRRQQGRHDGHLLPPLLPPMT